MVKKALKGNYSFSIKYFSDRTQKIIGPTNVKVTIIKNYGRKNESKEIKVYRLENNDGMLSVGTISI